MLVFRSLAQNAIHLTFPPVRTAPNPQASEFPDDIEETSNERQMLEQAVLVPALQLRTEVRLWRRLPEGAHAPLKP